MTHVPWHPTEMEEKGEIFGMESIKLTSVGIDIGTTTTHLMLSQLIARRRPGEHSSKFVVSERDIIYESDIILTPYTDDGLIDTEQIDAFIRNTYEKAGYDSEAIDTGAVIITGEANRKENADRIIDLFSEKAGKFVCATAGANLEALMAAHGSNVIDESLESDENILHIDIGGGTTKFAYVIDGFVEDTVSINVGTRLVQVDDEGRITDFEDAAASIADDLGISLARGAVFEPEDRSRFAERCGQLINEVVTYDLSGLAERLMVTDPPTVPDEAEFKVLSFSGGGAEYIYDRVSESYNDLGEEVGTAVSEAVTDQDVSVIELDAGIRATAVGATQHSMQVSGNTITITDDEILPLRNVPLIPFVIDHDDSVESIVNQMEQKLEFYDVNNLNKTFALGFHLHGSPTNEFLSKVADASIEVWEGSNNDQALILVFESDVAMSIGTLAKKRFDGPIISVDGVDLEQFGYIDVGEQLEQSGAVPLTIKSLVFEG